MQRILKKYEIRNPKLNIQPVFLFILENGLYATELVDTPSSTTERLGREIDDGWAYWVVEAVYNINNGYLKPYWEWKGTLRQHAVEVIEILSLPF